jgi:branched-chain amino acid transport system permease protein
MNIQFVIMQLFNGLILGSIYVILSLGLTIIFGMLGIINFAHGAFYMFGAFVAYTIVAYLIPNFWVALIVGPIVMGLFGAAFEAFLLRRLYDLPPRYIILFTFGLMLVLQDFIRMVYGAAGVPFSTPPSLNGSINLGFMFYPKYRIFLIIITSLCSLGMVDALGINISRIFTFVFGMGIGLAGLAGVLAAPLQNVSHLMGVDFLVDCFVVVVVGGMGSISGSIVGGLIVGEIIAFGVMVWPPMAHTLIYIFMAAFLLIRPRGLFGREAFHE